MSDDLYKAREMREKLLANPYRAKYHIVAPEGVCIPFDPNGAIYYNGFYHLFYIFQDKGSVHSWGHISSRDLVHWTHHPTALTADNTSPESGIFSGSAMMTKDGRPAIIYHGTEVGNCIAVSKDDMLIKWEKIPNNPIVKNPKNESDEGYGIYSSWDPHGWLEGNTYKAIFGGKELNLFSSENLLDWKFEGRFFDKPVRLNQPYEDYSCPDFFKLGDKYVLMFISHYRGVQYYVGEYKDGRFTPQKHERMNYYGGQLFANESLEDYNGRRIMWSWIMEARHISASREECFSGTMSLPRELTLGDDGLINVKPVEELKSLRYDEVSVGNIVVDGEEILEEISGRQLEIEFIMKPCSSEKAGIKVCCSADGKEETLIYFDNINKEVVIDTSNSSLRTDKFSPVRLVSSVDEDTEKLKTELSEELKTYGDEVRRDLTNKIECYVQRLRVKETESVKMRIFIDASVIEVFVNDCKCITQRVYPKYEGSNLARLFSVGGDAEISYLKAWKMDSSNAW